jgi:hypothetical protein
MAIDGISVDACVDLPSLPLHGQNMGSEIDEKSEAISTARCSHGLQSVPNCFQWMDVLPHVPCDVVQRIQSSLSAGGLLRQQRRPTDHRYRLLPLHLQTD